MDEANQPHAQRADIAELRIALELALGEGDSMEALLEVVGVITEAMVVDLGFVKEGRHWVYPGTAVTFEIPNHGLGGGDESELVTTKSGRRIRVITLEDMVIWRIREFLHWEGVRGFHQALYLLGNPRLDEPRLQRRAQEENLDDALDVIRNAAARIAKGEQIEDYEIHDAAKKLNEPI